MRLTGMQVVVRAVEQVRENELIFASRLYAEQLSNTVTEYAYYQSLVRMCKSGALCRIAKGTYYRPRISKYGVVPLSQKDIIAAFTKENQGTVVGYTLYNNLKLTTQVPKTVEVYSSQLDQQTKMISNVRLRFVNMDFTEEAKQMVHMLEVLQNFDEIQDLNYKQFIAFCEQFSSSYTDEIFKEVNRVIRYQKRTISFLREVLNYCGVNNNLEKYLSALSEYRHPTMEEIYEAARVS